MSLLSTLTETHHPGGKRERDQEIVVWKDVRFEEEFHLQSLKKTS